MLHIFDFDNTIYFSKREMITNTHNVLTHYGLDVEDKVIEESIGANTFDRFLSYGLDKQSVQAAADLFYKELTATKFFSKIESSFKKFIESLEGTFVIVTNSPSKYVENFLQENALQSQFANIYSSFDSGKSKKEIFKHLRNKLDRSKIMVYGDSWEECVASRYILAKFIAVNVWEKDENIVPFSDGVIHDYNEGIEHIELNDEEFDSLTQKYFITLIKNLNQKMIKVLTDCFINRERTILLFGNGGCNDIITHFITDYKRICFKHKKKINAYQIGQSKSLLSAVANDTNYYDLIKIESSLYPEKSDLIYLTTSDVNPNFSLEQDINNLFILNPNSLVQQKYVIPEIFESVLSYVMHHLIIRISNIYGYKS